jgi:Glycosyltransferase family 28 C-terminal domain
MVVDVSVEVSVLIRAMGVPVVVMGMPGERGDAAHQLSYRIAQAIIAPWPAWADLLGGGGAWRAKTHEVGAISRFDGRVRQPAPTPPGDRRRRVLLLSGLGGTELTAEQLAETRRATPESAWMNLGPPGDLWTADPWPLICGADVVVTHAGQNAIADVAAAGRPAIVVPQVRPHHEQEAMAAELHRAGLVTVCERWPAPHDWPSTLAMAAARGGEGWSRWTSGTGGQRAADVLKYYAEHEETQCA